MVIIVVLVVLLILVVWYKTNKENYIPHDCKSEHCRDGSSASGTLDGQNGLAPNYQSFMRPIGSPL